MNADGTVRETAEINDTTVGGLMLEETDRFGAAASVGDLDRDGVPDIAAGASGDDTGGDGRGAVHVMFMNADGTVRETSKIDGGTPNGPELHDDDGFGRSVAAVGDLDRDGVPDIAAGAPGDDAGGNTKGAVHVMLMSPTGGVRETIEINDTTAGGPALSRSDEFGFSVASVGDLDRDGVPDIAVGAPGDDVGDDRPGALHVLFMNADGSVGGTAKIDATVGELALTDFDWFGSSVAPAGDLDRDGVPDIVVGASEDDEGGDDAGALHVLFMNADGSVKGTAEINGTTANGPGLSDGDWFGSSVAVVDLDRDGVADIASGAPRSYTAGAGAGAVHVMFLDRSTVAVNVTSPDPDGTYSHPETVDVEVVFSDPVTVEGAPRLLLDTYPAERRAAYASGNNTDTLVFRYAVQRADNSEDLGYTGTGALSTNGGSIAAARSPGADAVLSLPPPGRPGSLSYNKDITIASKGERSPPGTAAFQDAAGLQARLVHPHRDPPAVADSASPQARLVHPHRDPPAVADSVKPSDHSVLTPTHSCTCRSFVFQR